MNARTLRRAALALALALGLVAAWAAGRALVGVEAPRETPGFAPEAATRARALLLHLIQGLAALQEADGGFALWELEDRPNPPEPEVQRTASSALAAWALVEAARLNLEVGSLDLGAVRDRALRYLASKQAPAPADGALGRMPRNPLGAAPDRGPEVTALAAATAAWARRGDRGDAVALSRAVRMLGSEVRAGLRDGWMRAVVALAIDALLSVGSARDLGPEPRRLLPPGEVPAQPDCGDYRVAEAVVRTLRAAAPPDPYPPEVVRVCLEREPPAWNGKATDLASWLMQAWLVARSPEPRPWFARLLDAVEEAQGARGHVPSGTYADRVAQTACACLALAHGLSAQPVVVK